ncbi:MAG: hypothetical protein Q9174_006524 [Haloplaca sp. 1 TL-2023]
MLSNLKSTSIGRRWTMATSNSEETSTWTTRLIYLCTLSIAFFVLVIYPLRFLQSRDDGYPDMAATIPATTDLLAVSSISTTKVAAIVETRPLGNLVPTILAFNSVLGRTWPLRVFHGPLNARLLESSLPIQRLVEEGKLTLSALPDRFDFTKYAGVSPFFADPWLWEQLAPANHVFIFQADSTICANSRRKVEDFLEYDFIGAPINPGYGQGYNGGISLRNREKMLEVIQYFAGEPVGSFEDQWFVQRLRELPPGPNGDPAARLPTPEVAGQFSVETIWHDEPLCMHQITRWHPEKADYLKGWCPEYQLAVEGGLHAHHKTDFALVDVPAETQAENNTIV